MTLEPKDQNLPPYAGWETVSGPGGPEPRPRRRPPGGRLAVAVAAAALVALGGAAAYAATTGGPGGSSTPAPGASGSATPPPSTSQPDHPGGGPGLWFGRNGNMAHGEATVKDPDSGQWIVKVWQRGTVQGTAGGTVTVKSADGSSWTWHTGSDTMVFKDGARSSGTAGIADGETVFLAGTRAADGSNTAERILIGTPKDSQRPGNRDDRGNRAPHRHHHGPWRGGPSSGGGASDSGSSSSGSSSGSLSPGSFS